MSKCNVASAFLLCLLVVAERLPGTISEEENISRGVHRIALDPSGALHLLWAVRGDTAYFHVDPSALHAGSWFALGFSDRGAPVRADFCVTWLDERGRRRIQDAWSDAEGILHVDYQQDCHLVAADDSVVSWKRLLDTCDYQDYDYVIDDGTTHIVWARGRVTDPSLRHDPFMRDVTMRSVSGINVTSAEHGMVRSQLVRAETTTPGNKQIDSADYTGDNRVGDDRKLVKMEVLADKVRVPADETTYWCHVRRLDEMLMKKHHIIQYEAVVQKGNEGLVHHMEVFHCEAPPDQKIPLYVGPCSSGKRPNDTQVCKKVISAWAMGAGPFMYPDEAGLPIGGRDFNLHVMLEVHYNNPARSPAYVDSSGIRMWVTSELRASDAAVMELGLEYTDKMAIPPGQPDFTINSFCIPECTRIGIPEGGITVFGSQLHTHLTGVRVRTRHARSGREMAPLNADEHYSTHFQEIRRLKRPVTVKPGDALITTCEYSTEHLKNVTLGGFAISDEMCVNYIHYYPATELEVCKSAISDRSLQAYFRYMREYENQPTSDANGISANYKAIEWSPIRAEFLRGLYDSEPISMQCNRSSGDRFPGRDWSEVPVPKISVPLLTPTPETRCRHV